MCCRFRKFVGKCKQKMHGGAFLANQRTNGRVQTRPSSVKGCRTWLARGKKAVPPGISFIVPIFEVLQLTLVKPLHLYFFLPFNPERRTVVGINSHLPLHWLRPPVIFNTILEDRAWAHVQQVPCSICEGKMYTIHDDKLGGDGHGFLCLETCVWY